MSVFCNSPKTFKIKLTNDRRKTLRLLRRIDQDLRDQGTTKEFLEEMRATLEAALFQGMADPREFPIVEELLERYGYVLQKARA